MKITGVQVRMFSSLIPPERRHRTDLGQAYSPVPAEGYRMFLAALLKCGVTPAEIEVMACRNPARLLGI